MFGIKNEVDCLSAKKKRKLSPPKHGREVTDFLATPAHRFIGAVMEENNVRLDL